MIDEHRHAINRLGHIIPVRAEPQQPVAHASIFKSMPCLLAWGGLAHS